jgi:hypothetical protein
VQLKPVGNFKTLKKPAFDCGLLFCLSHGSMPRATARIRATGRSVRACLPSAHMGPAAGADFVNAGAGSFYAAVIANQNAIVQYFDSVALWISGTERDFITLVTKRDGYILWRLPADVVLNTIAKEILVGLRSHVSNSLALLSADIGRAATLRRGM